jgi:hypothetical protein
MSKTNQDSSSASGGLCSHETCIDRVNASIYQKWQDTVGLKREGRDKSNANLYILRGGREAVGKTQLGVQRQGGENLSL